MRRAPLRSDPAKVREWNDKHRGQHLTSRSTLDGFKAPARKPPKRPDPIPSETRAAARARSGGRCVVCLYLNGGKVNRRVKKAAHLHHTFEKQANKFPGLALVEDGLVGLCWQHHQDAHGARRIPLLALPECVFRLAADVGPGAVDYLLGPTYARE